MRKTVFYCAANATLFILLGLAVLFPFSQVTRTEYGFEGTLTVFPLLLLVWLVVYPLLHRLLARKYRWSKGAGSELACRDEREQAIVARSIKTAYQVLIGGLITVVSVIGAARIWGLATGMDLNTTFLAVALLTLLLTAATGAYGIRWCWEYKR